jgi:DNA-binding NarL/FixJ family response regulator
VVLTAHADPVFARRAAEAGASGFIPKDVRIAKIVGAVRAVMAGELAVEPTVLRSLLAQAAAEGREAGGPATGTGQPALPAEQVMVLELLAGGAGLEGIAAKLGGDGLATVTAAVAGLGARSPLEAVVLAARLGLLAPTPG